MPIRPTSAIQVGFEFAYRSGLPLVNSGGRRSMALACGNDAPEDAYQQAALEFWQAATESRLPSVVYDGASLDVNVQRTYLLNRTDERLKDRRAKVVREPLIVDEDWGKSEASGLIDSWCVEDEVFEEIVRVTDACDLLLEIAGRATRLGPKVIWLLRDGYTHAEIGDILHVRPGASRAALCRVRKEILSAIESGEIEMHGL